MLGKCCLCILCGIKNCFLVVFVYRLMRCFSLTYNLKQFFEARSQNSELKVLNALKSFCFLYVILSHTTQTSEHGFPSEFDYFQNVTQKSQFFKFCYFGGLAVDLFFFIGGFLLAYATLDPRKLKTFNYFCPWNLVKVAIHRVARIWPALFVVLMIHWKLTYHVGHGPLWGLYQGVIERCDTKRLGW